MNILEMNEKIYQHLKKQNKVAINEVGQCMYRCSDGTMCAVGCLIKDEAYDPKMEHNGILNGTLVKEGLEKSGIEMTQDTINFLNSWQEFHDGHLDDVSGKEYQKELKKFYEEMEQEWSNK